MPGPADGAAPLPIAAQTGGEGACAACGAALPVRAGTGGTGYANLVPDPEARGTPGHGRICYRCAAVDEAVAMSRTGRTFLYAGRMGSPAYPGAFAPLTVTNWPGSLKFPAWGRTTGDGFGRGKTRVWFRTPDGAYWAGVGPSETGTYVRCRRLKRAPAGLSMPAPQNVISEGSA